MIGFVCSPEMLFATFLSCKSMLIGLMCRLCKIFANLHTVIHTHILTNKHIHTHTHIHTEIHKNNFANFKRARFYQKLFGHDLISADLFLFHFFFSSLLCPLSDLWPVYPLYNMFNNRSFFIEIKFAFLVFLIAVVRFEDMVTENTGVCFS